MDTKTITKRIQPCSCGCGGRDPWHAQTFERVIKDIAPETGTCRVTAYSEPVTYRSVGRAKFPWSEDLVKVVEVTIEVNGRVYNMGWFIAREVE